MTKKATNPFLINRYGGAEFFCDRIEETSYLINNLINGNSVTLISKRRIGKTGLIMHCLDQLPDGYKGIYVDIMQTENLTGFFSMLASAMVRMQSEDSSLGKKIMTFIKSLRPIISFDNLTGEPQVAFDISNNQAALNIESLLSFFEKQPFKTIIAIDEFQQINNYPENNTEAWLRSKIQQLKNVVFIFSGSQQHLMNEMFTSSKRPFFRSTQIMKLEKIDKNIYADFVISLFQKYHKEISRQMVGEVLDYANVHTFYVQQLFNRIFSISGRVVSEDSWRQEAQRILREQDIVFYTYRNMLTKNQWQLLKAIAIERKVFQISSSSFIEKHKLRASPVILRSLKTLLDDELIYFDFDENGRKYYSVSDVWLERWLEKI